jgi:Tfp pilus assembly protein PilE
VYCGNCGTENADNAVKCVNCGGNLQPVAPPPISSEQKVPTYLAPAILTTLFCCLPLGIVAIVFAAQVGGKLQAGDYDGALNASKKAKIWCWISFGAGLAFVAISILAAIAIPQFASYKIKAYNAVAEADLKNAMAAQQAYYVEHDTYADSIDKLTATEYGLHVSPEVALEVISADNNEYEMVASHDQGNRQYTVKGPNGQIEETIP